MFFGMSLIASVQIRPLGMNASAFSNVLVEVTVATKAVNNNTTGVGAYSEAAGLHRAHKADVFAWADSSAGTAGGRVYSIK